MTIRELTAEMMEFLALAEAEDLDAQAIKDTFEAIEGEFEAKADAYAMVRAELKGDYAKLKAEYDRIGAKMNAIKNNIDHINETLMWAMNTTGKTSFKTDLYSFGIAKNGGVAPLEIVGFVPEEFTHTEIVNDNEAIREYIAEHPDCKWARLGERGVHLNLR